MTTLLPRAQVPIVAGERDSRRAGPLLAGLYSVAYITIVAERFADTEPVYTLLRSGARIVVIAPHSVITPDHGAAPLINVTGGSLTGPKG